MPECPQNDPSANGSVSVQKYSTPDVSLSSLQGTQGETINVQLSVAPAAVVNGALVPLMVDKKEQLSFWFKLGFGHKQGHEAKPKQSNVQDAKPDPADPEESELIKVQARSGTAVKHRA